MSPFGIYGTSIHVTYLLVYMLPVYMSLKIPVYMSPFGAYDTSIHVTYILVYTVPVYMSLTFWCIRYQYTCHLLVYTVYTATVYTKR